MTDEERRMFSNRLRERDAEIERLRLLQENSKHWEAQHLAEIERQQAEIEHLRTTIGYLADNISDYPALVAVAEATLKPRP